MGAQPAHLPPSYVCLPLNPHLPAITVLANPTELSIIRPRAFRLPCGDISYKADVWNPRLTARSRWH